MCACSVGGGGGGCLLSQESDHPKDKYHIKSETVDQVGCINFRQRHIQSVSGSLYTCCFYKQDIYLCCVFLIENNFQKACIKKLLKFAY